MNVEAVWKVLDYTCNFETYFTFLILTIFPNTVSLAVPPSNIVKWSLIPWLMNPLPQQRLIHKYYKNAVFWRT